MVLNLIRINGSTPIKGFDKIYNTNNSEIESGINSVEDKADRIYSEFDSFRLKIVNKFNKLQQELILTQEELKLTKIELAKVKGKPTDNNLNDDSDFYNNLNDDSDSDSDFI